MARDRKMAECWNCNRPYDQIYLEHGGVVGVCNACDSKHWVIAPSEAKEGKRKRKIVKDMIEKDVFLAEAKKSKKKRKGKL